MDIKPIETVYNGYRFRSRLEARWAVFFDAAGIKYQYEPEGYEVNHWQGEQPIRYLPDFYLPDYGCWAEVKPSKSKLMEDQEKLSWMIDYGGPMANGLLILGQIPVLNDVKFILPKFTLYKWNKGIDLYLASFIASDLKGGMKIQLVEEYCGISDAAPFLPEPIVGEELYLNACNITITKDDLEWILHPYFVTHSAIIMDEFLKKARQARFEHGETPKGRM